MIVVKEKNHLRSFNSAVLSLAEVEGKRPYISLRLKLCDNKANLNGEGTTVDFIEDVVANKDAYITLPLVADVTKIERGDYYNGMGHLYDAETDSFMTKQVGSFYDFEVQTDEDGTVSLIGEARVFKRNTKVVAAIKDLHEKGLLAFSFEVEVGEPRIENGVLWVGASPLNKLIGVALVSSPACETAKSLSLVAEAKDKGYLKATERAFVASRVITAEPSLETVTRWIYDAVYAFIRNNFGYFDFYFYHIGMDSAVLYASDTGDLFRVDYIVRENDVWVSDFYPVEVKRISAHQDSEEKEEPTLKDELNPVVEAEETEKVEPKVEAKVEAEVEETVDKTVDEAEVKDEVAPESAQAEEEAADEKPETEETPDLEAKLAEQAKRIAELEEIEAKWLAAQEADEQAKVAAKKEKVAEFAKNSGLDLEAEAVVAAIDAMDYESLVSMVIDNQSAQGAEVETDTKVAETVVNKLAEDMKTSSTSWLYQKG